MNQKKSFILIVDDEEANRNILHDRIISMGHNPLLAKDSVSAFSIIKEQKPDLILLDIKMPGMNGYEMCERLQTYTDTKKIPVIFITADNSSISEQKCFEVGGNDYITKPFNSKVLQARINNQLSIINQRNMKEKLLKKSRRDIIAVLNEILEKLNPFAFSRIQALQQYTNILTEMLNLPYKNHYSNATLVSYLGVITLPEGLIEKIYLGEKLDVTEASAFEHQNILASGWIKKIPNMKIISQMLINKELPMFDDPNRKELIKMEPAILGGHILKTVHEVDKLICSGLDVRECIESLREKKFCFPIFISAFEKNLKISTEGITISTVNIDQIQVGMEVNEDIWSTDRTLLVKKGTQITTSRLNAIQRYSQKGIIEEPIRVIIPKTAHADQGVKG